MAPLILHNVPDEELYIGDDGVQRPYAMLFPQQDGHQPGPRGRRAVAESGAFGKSARRSRSKTGTPAKREDPTLQAADKVFSSWFEQQNKSRGSAPASTISTPQQRKSSLAAPTQSNIGAQVVDDATAATSSRPHFMKEKEPAEVILKGYRSAEQQYAAINHYEQLAGRICEDYPRDPPPGSRRYKSELRDPAFTRRGGVTPTERVMANRTDSGEHWVKVTFESAEAAEAAVYASPQAVLGHLVYAEPYLGIPPMYDEATPDRAAAEAAEEEPLVRSGSRGGFGSNSRRDSGRRRGQNGPSLDNNGGGGGGRSTLLDASPPQSQSSSRTADTATVSAGSGSNTATASTTTVTGPFMARGGSTGSSTRKQIMPLGTPTLEHSPNNTDNTSVNSLYCRTIPSARKARLMPAEQALLPQPSYAQRVLNMVPFLRWFGGSMIGNEVPRNDAGDFDWDRASLYWKVIWWLDSTFGVFGGEILTADRED